jgi:hypothetical protein
MTGKKVAMSIQLTEEQRKALEQGGENPPRVIDPVTNVSYVLVRSDIYERVQALFADDDWDARQGYSAFLQAAGEEWDDPALDVYEQYRKRP